MNNTISLVYSANKQLKYDIGQQIVNIKLLSNSYDLDPEQLFAMATRKNKKRSFLFVSKVLGKHIPINPFRGLLGGLLLGLRFGEQVEGISNKNTQPLIEAFNGMLHPGTAFEAMINNPVNLSQKTLFIGFAETATALGYSMFTLFNNASYVHTTREFIPELKTSVAFEEEHSHATAHRLYLLNSELLINSERVVLVDDEITTGKTALNIIHEIQCRYPKKEYIIATLLDWRTQNNLEEFNAFMKEHNVIIQVVSLLRGEVSFSSSIFMGDEEVDVAAVSDFTVNKPGYETVEIDLGETIKVVSQDGVGLMNSAPYLKDSGRFGLRDTEKCRIISNCKEAGLELKKRRQGKKTLCLGTGEYMFLPMLISAYMGEGISYQSSTRSPIVPLKEAKYAINSRSLYPSPEDPAISNFLYNIPPNFYDEVFLFLERQVLEDRLQSMIAILKKKGLSQIVVVLPEVQ